MTFYSSNQLVKIMDNKQSIMNNVMIPNVKLRKTGGCYVVTIPQEVVKKYLLRNGSRIHICLFSRKDETVDKFFKTKKEKSKKDDIFDIDI